MSTRRHFLHKLVGAASAGSLLSLTHPVFAEQAADWKKKLEAVPDDQVLTDEQFWGWVRESYTVNPNIINLNNGGVAPQPKVVQDAHIRFYQYANELPTLYMWQHMDQGREPLRQHLAELAGCSADELAINRNSTEGLNTVIFGLNLKQGDEVVLTKLDYPNMIHAWKQREKRDGIKLVWLDLKQPEESEDAIVQAFIRAFTPRTRVVMITHLINWTGQILPVARIAREARRRNIDVLVDGAHTFAHLDFKIPDLQCDYFATSLHKWLSAPFGSGLLYIRKEKIKDVWALLSSAEPDGPDIRKFESLGTRSFASEMAIGNAVDFHDIIGGKRKEARLRYLKDYWVNQVKDLPGISFYQPSTPHLSGAIANFSLAGKTTQDITRELFNNYRIHSVAIDWEQVHGVRITPNVYTSLRELDQLVKAIRTLTGKTR